MRLGLLPGSLGAGVLMLSSDFIVLLSLAPR